MTFNTVSFDVEKYTIRKRSNFAAKYCDFWLMQLIILEVY